MKWKGKVKEDSPPYKQKQWREIIAPTLAPFKCFHQFGVEFLILIPLFILLLFKCAFSATLENQPKLQALQSRFAETYKVFYKNLQNVTTQTFV